MEGGESRFTKIVIIETENEAIVAQVLREQLGGVDRGQRIYIEKVERMGDLNYAGGPAAVAGSQARSENASLFQLSLEGIGDIDLIKLAVQLEIVRVVMQRQSGAERTAEQDDEIGHVAGAQIAAQRGDGKGVLAHLKQAGLWTFKVAKETGTEIVALTLAHILAG